MADPLITPQPQAVVTQPMEIDDFSGGKTDNYIAGQINQFEDADNFVLKRHGGKAKLITRFGSEVYDSVCYRVPSSSRVGAVTDLDGDLFVISGRNVYRPSTSWGTLQGPTTNPVFSVASDYISWARWNKHLILTNEALSKPQKIYKDGSTWKVRNLGLPAIDANTVTLAASSTGTTYSYIYAFIRSDEYTSGSVTFKEVSATDVKSIQTGAEIGTGGTPVSVTVSTLPVLSNGSTDNYNTTGIKIEIYRTTNGGTTFFKVGEVTNGTTSFIDTTKDTNIQSNEVLYTDGGTLDFDEAPPAKYVVVNGDVAFYLHVKEGSTVYPNRIRQSIPGALYASPESFYEDVDDEITGAASFNGYLIVFCKTRTYRFEGTVDELGQGSISKKEISSSVGCVSHRSIVTTPDGVFFASENGFFYTNGVDLKEMSGEFPESYQELVQSDTLKARIYGAYDPLEKRIWWAAQRDLGSADNDIIFVADLKFTDGTRAPFTTLSGGNLIDNFAPTCLHYFKGHMLRGDRRGYLFRHRENLYSDPKIDTSKTPDQWDKATIIYDYRSPAFDFGTGKVRKWVPRIVVNAENETNLSLKIFSNNDNSGVFNELGEIRYSGSHVWGDPTSRWGDTSARWNYKPTINHWRRFPSPLRCSYKQVRFTNAYTLVDDFTTSGMASTNGTTKKVTLDNVAMKWIANAVDYNISFEDESYAKEWAITNRTDTELTVNDPLSQFTTGVGRNWRIHGYRKDQILNLLSYVIDFAPLTMSQEPYRANN